MKLRRVFPGRAIGESMSLSRSTFLAKFWAAVGFLCAVMPMYGSSTDSCPFQIPEGALVSSGLNPRFVAQCALFLAFMILWTVFIGKFLKLTFRLPVIAGQIVAGILLGPSFLDIKSLKVFSGPVFAFDWATHQLYALPASDFFVMFVLLLAAVFTVPYLLWIAGHETDIKDILKVGITAVSAGILGAVIPIVVTVLGAYYGFGSEFDFVQSLGFGLVLSATSVSIPIAMFFAQNRMQLKTSKATLGAAIIDDIAAVVALSVFFICYNNGMFGAVAQDALAKHHADSVIWAFVYMLVSFAVIFFTGYFIIPPVLRLLKRSRLSHLIASVANGTMFLYFSFAELVGGLSGITGAYFAGLFHRTGDDRHHAVKVISPFVNAVLLPLFLGSIGLQVNVGVLNRSQWVIVGVLLVLAIFSKMLPCYIATWVSNLSGRRKRDKWTVLEGFLFGSSMVARGEVGLVVATILHGAHILPQDMYVMAVVVIVLTTVASPIMLGIGFAAFDKTMKLKETAKSSEYSLNIGLFKIIGSNQMFNIIVRKIESFPSFKATSIVMAEGRQIVNVEGQDVKVILSPGEGIFFEGNKRKIEQILQAVKKSVQAEAERLSES